MVCPRCNGQGNIYRGLIQALSLTVYVCDECEATWLNGEKITIDNFRNLGEIYDEYSLVQRENRITNDTYDWECN